MADKDRFREIFVPDSGALVNLRVFEITEDDWQTLLDFLSANYSLNYTEDGATKQLPRFTTIWQTRNERSVALAVVLSGCTISTHFFDNEEIQLDVLPDEIDSAEKAEAVFTLMKSIARILQKQVYLVPEFGGAAPDTLKRMAICWCDAQGNAVKYPAERK